MITAKEFASSLLNALWLVPVLTAVGQLIKVSTPAITRWISLLVAVLGIASGLLFVGLSALGAVVGLCVGMAATGLYEIGSTAIAGK